ncbi:MAG: pyridoxamine 5'-phosphate oxidase family protein [Candidatus Cloacimonadaceae bacterium]|nr:pyridoxamine 5'-phosphate oxidase family protein [Candidatus Cloacimonadaceae bacterium]MDP3114895.1 pyridoxamine 5'-phosphate oxidase family protein [Candidatus Cloacimonadaceae bacterium]
MLESIKEYLKDKMAADLATCDNGQPRLRPMTLMHLEDKLWIATGTTDAKSAQLASNPLCEALLHIKKEQNSGYIRISAKAVLITDLALKKTIADFSDFVYDYFPEAADEGYALYELVPHSIRLMKPGEMYETEMLK